MTIDVATECLKGIRREIRYYQHRVDTMRRDLKLDCEPSRRTRMYKKWRRYRAGEMHLAALGTLYFLLKELEKLKQIREDIKAVIQLIHSGGLKPH